MTVTELKKVRIKAVFHGPIDQSDHVLHGIGAFYRHGPKAVMGAKSEVDAGILPPIFELLFRRPRRGARTPSRVPGRSDRRREERSFR